ncbi:MAG: Zn-ribbon domain-containing OB-fold protein [Chloroflexota bacterium]|nr:Zn-ribbon domain-containing OB-fold protein [Chloroflexota bacterium]
MIKQLHPLPGAPLSEQDFKEKRILFNYDELRGDFGWDTGIAIGQFLAGLKDGLILGSQCSTCRKIVVPPRAVCEWCFRPMNDYIPLLDTGTVSTYSLCYVTWDVKRIEDPEIPAVIEIDGASPLHGIMHLLGEVDTDDVNIGMRVKAVWKPPEERQGSITDILYFKPIEDV